MPLRLLVRLQRNGLVATAYFGIAYALINSAAYPLVAGRTRALQEAFGAEVHVLGAQFAWLLPLPLHPETAAGYLQWRGYGVDAIVVAVWALFSGCGAVRRDEERGFVEAWLAAGIGRAQLFAWRCSAFAATSALVVALTGLAGWAGCELAGMPAGAAGVVLQSLALWTLALAAYGISALIAELTVDHRSAATAGRVVLLALFLVDSVGRSSTVRPALTNVSVFSLYDRSNAVAAGGTFDAVATLVLLGVAAAMLALAARAFVLRDAGAGLIRVRPRHRRALRDASSNPLFRIPVLRSLWVHRTGFGAWSAAMALFAAFAVGLINVSATFFEKTPSLTAYLRGLPGDIHVVLLALIWFTIAEALIAVLAITHVARWTSEDDSGLLEMELSEPTSRLRLLAERAAELIVTLAVVSFISSTVIVLVAPVAGISIDAGSMYVATALLLPLGLAVAAVGAVLAGWRPRAAVGALVAATVVSYLVYQVAPLFRWPEWVADLSVFQLYGTPLVTAVFAGGLAALIGIAVIGFAAAGVTLQRRDVSA